MDALQIIIQIWFMLFFCRNLFIFIVLVFPKYIIKKNVICKKYKKKLIAISTYAAILKIYTVHFNVLYL